jgi:hypothetical protein
MAHAHCSFRNMPKSPRRRASDLHHRARMPIKQFVERRARRLNR